MSRWFAREAVRANEVLEALRHRGENVKRVKWTYEAELDYIHEQGPGEWVIGFLDEEGSPYECPHTTDETLVRKLEKLEDKKLRVTVEVNEELDSRGQQHPKLLDAHVQKKRRQAQKV